MSFVKHLKEEGIKLTPDSTLPMGHRTVKNFKRCIAAVRAAEAEANDEINAANEKCREAQAEAIELQNRLRKVELELLQYKLKDRTDEFEQLDKRDKSRLLEAVGFKAPEAVGVKAPEAV